MYELQGWSKDGPRVVSLYTNDCSSKVNSIFTGLCVRLAVLRVELGVPAPVLEDVGLLLHQQRLVDVGLVVPDCDVFP